jgi:hypothetical protein
VKTPVHKNKHARTTALTKIEAALRPLKPDINVNDLKSKFHALKTTFLAEHKKYVTSRQLLCFFKA